jgi:(p)ppGpp synthase/HD superfamily hydrolase
MPQLTRKYGALLYEAIELSARAHRLQVRKGTEIPYLVHPLAVAGILINAGCPEPLVIAGVLHDTLEDTPLTLAEIRARFGDQVAELVRALSEPDKKASWEERKRHTLDYLDAEAPADVLMVALADKLDNIRALRKGLERHGESYWRRFNRARASQQWYYRGLAAVFARRLAGDPPAAALLSRFTAEVEQAFGRP